MTTTARTQLRPEAVQVPPEAAEPGRRPRTRLRLAVRLALPPVVAVAAFPGALVQLGAGDDTGGALAAVLTVLGLGLLWGMAAAPGAREPEVHDRQLDIILAVPLVAAAGWLVLGAADPLVRGEDLGSVGLAAFALFLCGATVLLLGTRLALRLRGVLLLIVITLLCASAAPAARAAVGPVLLLLALAGLVRRTVARRRLVQRSPVRDDAGGHLGDPAAARRAAPSATRQQRLPRARPSLAVVAVLAAGLGLAGWSAGSERLAPAPPTLALEPAPATGPVRGPDTAEARRVLQAFADSVDADERRALLEEYVRVSGVRP